MGRLCSLLQKFDTPVRPHLNIRGSVIRCSRSANLSEYRQVARHYGASARQGLRKRKAEAFRLGRVEEQGGATVDCGEDATVEEGQDRYCVTNL
jgi:hypothetical protein